MKSPEFSLGFLVGLVLVFVIALVVVAITKKKNGTAKYDERQELIRGRAFKYAFWVLVSYLCLNGFIQLGTGIEWADLMTSSFIGICLSMTVFVVACIRNDAYFAVNQKPKFYLVMFALLVVLNLTIGILNMLDGDVQFITDGRLNYHAMSFIVVLMFLLAFIALAIKAAEKKRMENRG